MSTEIATVGIRVDATGAVETTRRVRGELLVLGTSGEKVQKQIEHLAKGAVFSLSDLASRGSADLGSLAKSATNLGFAMGGAVGVAVLAIGGIVDAWQDSRKRTHEEQEKMLADIRAFASKYSEEGLRVSIGALERRANSLTAASGRTATQEATPLAAFGHQLRDAFGLAAPEAGALQEVNNALARERALLADIIRDNAAKKHADDLKHAADEAKRLAEEWERISSAIERQLPKMTATKDAAREYAAVMRELDDSLGGVAAKRAAQDAHGAAEQQKSDMDEILFRLRQELDLMGDIEDQGKRNRDILLSAGAGILSGVMQHQSGIGGVIGNVGGAVIGAAATGNPFAMAAAGAQAFVSSIFALGDAEHEHQRQLEATRRQLEAFIDVQKEELGLLTPLEVQLKAITREYAAQRDALSGGKTADELQRTLDAITRFEVGASAAAIRMFEKRKAEIEEQIAQLAVLDPLEKERIEDLNREIEFQHKLADEDLQARALRAAGLNEEADALELLAAQQRELENARKSGYDATQLAILAEIQRAEAINVSIAKVQAKIDDLAATIAGLKDFRNALLLSPAAGLSPTAALSEAERQYAEILGQAKGGNQDAAGRLPGAAQSLLELARTVFGSGSDFQSIFQNVLTDTQDLIERFEGQKTIQEQILAELVKTREEELAKIRLFLEPIGEVLHGASGTINIDQSTYLQAQLDATLAGFTRVSSDLQAVQQAIADLQYATRTGFDGMRANYA